jgi:hypothetical protein
MGGNIETEVAQNLRAKPVAQTDIFESDQAQLRSMLRPTAGGARRPPKRSPAQGFRSVEFRSKAGGFDGFRFDDGVILLIACASVMVSDSLTDVL